MGRKVLVRQPMLHGSGNRLLKCEVLSEADGKLRCKCEGELKPREVTASEAIPAETVMGSGQGMQTVIQKQYPTSLHTLANMIK